MRVHAQGFTLVEMVVAFAILGLSLTALYSAFESALVRAGHDGRLNEGTLIAQSLLARASFEWPLQDGVRSGDWNGFAYEIAEQTVAAPSGEQPYTVPTIQVTASVSWPEAAGMRHIAMSTRQFRPASSP
jgi:general secretion pathway protein I